MNIFKSKNHTEYNYIIDLCKNYIKIVRAVKKGKEFLIDKVFVLNLDELSEEKIKDFFDKLLPSTYHFNLLTFVSRKDTTVKYISIPSIILKEIDKMVEFQIEKEIPYPIEEISYGYQIQSIETGKYSQIMVVITHKKKISTIMDIFKKYGLVFDFVTLDVDALLNWFNFTYDAQDAPIGLVDIDMYKSNLIIVKNAKINFSRSIVVDISKPDDSSEHVLNDLVDEIIRSLNIYQKDKSEGVKELVITGAEGIFNNLKSKLENYLQGKVKVQSCFENIPLSFSDKLKKESSECLSFAYLVGAVLPSRVDETLKSNLDFKHKGFEFLPYELRQAKESKIKKIILKKVTLTFIGFLLVIMAIVLYKGYALNKKLALLDNRLSQISVQVEQARREVSSMRALSDYLKGRSYSLDILREIHIKVPDLVFLTRLELNRNDGLILEGEANKISQVFAFVSSLEESVHFDRVNAHDVTVNEKSGKKIVNFQIHCSIKKHNK